MKVFLLWLSLLLSLGEACRLGEEHLRKLEKATSGNGVVGSYIIRFKDTVKKPKDKANKLMKEKKGKLDRVFSIINGFSVSNLGQEELEDLLKDEEVAVVEEVRKEQRRYSFSRPFHFSYSYVLAFEHF